VINQKYEGGGRFKFKIRILFYEGNLRTVALRQTKFDEIKLWTRLQVLFESFSVLISF
jgi:hypothetical protein